MTFFFFFYKNWNRTISEGKEFHHPRVRHLPLLDHGGIRRANLGFRIMFEKTLDLHSAVKSGLICNYEAIII